MNSKIDAFMDELFCVASGEVHEQGYMIYFETDRIWLAKDGSFWTFNPLGGGEEKRCVR